jgi:predicted NodU family carbamoyl transferase
VWVQPAAHDAGNALGAALSVLHDQGVPMASKERTSVSVLLNTSFNNHAEPVVDSGVRQVFPSLGFAFLPALAPETVEAPHPFP